jgi:CRP-like cAMP-binding protein
MIMSNPLTMKLEQFTAFSDDDRRRLDAIASTRTRTWGARQDILREGDHVGDIHLVLSGLAARYKILPDGSRQIMAFLVPGDLCDIEVFVLDQMDHSIGALTETKCALIAADEVMDLITNMHGLTRALWWSTMTDSAVLRERIIDHGRRDARERIAHLFYEMLVRYRMIGQAIDDSYEFPVTQEELADATGMTPVHVNRTLKQLRDEQLIEFKGRVLTVLDPEALKNAGRFNAAYLHLQRTEQEDPLVSERVGDLL